MIKMAQKRQMGKSLGDSRVRQRQGAGRISAFSVNFEVRWEQN